LAPHSLSSQELRRDVNYSDVQRKPLLHP